MLTPYQTYLAKQASTAVTRMMARGWKPDAKDLERLQELYKGYTEKGIKSLGHGTSNQADMVWLPRPEVHNVPNHGIAVRKSVRDNEMIPDILAHPDTKLVKHVKDLQDRGQGASFARVYDVDPATGLQYHEFIEGKPLDEQRMIDAGKHKEYKRLKRAYKAIERRNRLRARGATGRLLSEADNNVTNTLDRVGKTREQIVAAEQVYKTIGHLGDYKYDKQPTQLGARMGMPIDYEHNPYRPEAQREDLLRVQRKFPRAWDVFGTNVQVDKRTGAHKIIDMSGDYNNQYIVKPHKAFRRPRFAQFNHPSRQRPTDI